MPDATVPIPLEPAPSPRNAGRPAQLLFGIMFLAILAGAIVGLSRPWLRLGQPAAPLGHFAPMGEGDAALYALYDATGAQTGWRSVNVDVLSKIELFTGLPEEVYSVVHGHFFPEESVDATGLADSRSIFAELGDARGARVYFTTRLLGGKVSRQEAVVLDDDPGRYLVSIANPADGTGAIYDPPLLLLPADLGATLRWGSSGLLSAALPYTATAAIVGTGAGPAAPDLECVEVEASQQFGDGQGGAFATTALDTYCTGLGNVSSTVLDAGGNVLERVELHRSTRAGERVDLNPALASPDFFMQPAPSTRRAPAAGDENHAGGIRRFGQVNSYYTTGGGTFQPVLMTGDPPLLLVSAYESEIKAYAPNGDERWRFVPGGSIYAPPAVDPATGMIYFGTSNKRFIALDRDGLFRWSFTTGDNNATTPALVDSLVIFASEDRHIYALDAQNGRQVWQVETESPIVSSPALVGDTVVIGADSGLVRGLDPATGATRWEFPADGPVEADIVAAPDDDIAYVAGRDGQVTALDGGTGAVLWQSTAGFGPGSPIGYRPVLQEDRLAVVAASGTLSVLDRGTGQTMWSTHLSETFVPPAVFDGDTVIAATAFGRLLRYDPDGTLVEELDLSTASAPDDPVILLHIGPVAGGDTLWLIDSASIIYQLPARASGKERE